MQTRFIHRALTTGLSAIAALLLLPATGSATDSNPGTSDGPQRRSTPKGYDGESLFDWDTLPPKVAGYYANFMEQNGITWLFGAQKVSGSEASIEGHPVSIIYHASGSSVYDLYYDMTLTGFKYSNTNSSRDIVIPEVSWASHGADGGGATGPLQYIPSSVFNGTDITSVTIPYTLLALQEPCFLNCRDLKSIKIVWWSVEVTDDDQWDYTDTRYRSKDGVLYNKAMTRLIKYPEGKTDRSFAIPPTVTELSPYAFANAQLAELTIPDSVTVIPSNAFSGCTGLVSIAVGNGVTDLSDIPWNDNMVSVVLGDGITNFPNVFNGSTSLVSVVLGNGITDVPAWAFIGCSRLASVTLGNGITKLPNFWGCTNLSSVTLGNRVTEIPDRTFAGCTALERMVIPNSVRSIGFQAFDGCTGLAAVVFGTGLESIGDQAFYGCSGLADVTIPDRVTSLGDLAFYGCSGLEWVKIGKGVTDEGGFRRAFSWCNGIRQFLVDADHPAWTNVDGVLFARDMSRVIRFPAGKSGTFSVPAGVVSIAESCFEDCAGLTGVALPEGLEQIEDRAFQGCEGLAAVEIPDSVEVVGTWAFDGCCGLKSVEIGAGAADIGSGAFSDCDALERFGVAAGNPAYSAEDGVLFSKDKRLLIQCPPAKGGSYAVPAGVERIGEGAFSGCGGLTAVDFPDGVLDIGECAFQSCGGLTSVAIPDSVESIGERAFSLCGALENVGIGAGVTNIGRWAFMSDPALMAFDVATDNPAFAGRDGVLFSKDMGTLVLFTLGKGGSYKVPDGVERIGERAFEGAGGLTGVEFPASLADIGEAAFSMCGKLAAITVPEGVTDIGYRAFADCPALASATLPDSLVRLGQYAFGRYDDWESEFAEELFDTATIPGVKLVDGWVVYDAWASYPEVLDLSAARGLSDGAFTGASFRSVILPEGLSAIGPDTFLYCMQLASLMIPAGVAFVGERAFAGCSALETIGVAAGNAHFADEDGILFSKDKKRLLCFPAGKTGDQSIPGGVEEIGAFAFDSCWRLTGLVLPESLAEIGRGAFQQCSGLTGLELPGSVTHVGDWAFGSCTSLASLELHDGVEDIGNYAFWGCSALASLTMPDSVVRLGDDAFADCSGLATLSVPGKWKGTSMLAAAAVPAGCNVLFRDVPGEPSTQDTPVPVAHSWLEAQAADILAANGGDYEAAANATAANGRPVWECYVADISPAGATDFKVTFVQENGEWVPKPTPEHSGTRRYVIEGSPAIGEAWGAPNENSRFFRAKVMLP